MFGKKKYVAIVKMLQATDFFKAGDVTPITAGIDNIPVGFDTPEAAEKQARLLEASGWLEFLRTEEAKGKTVPLPTVPR